jgi:hypothetical protein
MEHAYTITFSDAHGEDSLYMQASTMQSAIDIFELMYPDCKFITISVEY